MATPALFENGRWSDYALTDLITKVPRKLTQVTRLGLFAWTGITTRTVRIGVNEGQIDVVPSKPYGAPPNQNVRTGRNVRSVDVPRFPIADFVQAEEVQGAFVLNLAGEIIDLVPETVDNLYQTRANELAEKLDNTVSHLELGAIKGIALDADGSTLANFFTIMGETQTVIDFDLDNPASETEEHANELARAIGAGLNGDTRSGNRALCGVEFYDKLRNHPNTKVAFKESTGNGARRAEDLTDGPYEAFRLGRVVFELFEGELYGQPFVADAECHAFPEGSSIFRGAFAPAGFLDAVNKPGLPRYLKKKIAGFDTGIELLAETCALAYPRRPKSLVKGQV